MYSGKLWSKETCLGLMTLAWQGDSQLFIRFPERIDALINENVIALNNCFEKHPYIEETVPGYHTLALEIGLEGLMQLEKWLPEFIGLLDDVVSEMDKRNTTAGGSIDITALEGRMIKLPICYNEEFGPDLTYVAEYTGLTALEVVKRHVSQHYRVYMLGFSPGFPYLGGMDPSLQTPRLKVPRLKIPPGSVGIADYQTGIYPQETPGGWQIIGRCPILLFDIKSESPAKLRAGDTVIFVPIEPEVYRRLELDGGRSWQFT